MLNIPDYSEFQGHVVPTGFEVVIVRAHNGWRADYDFIANRASAHQCGVRALGLYQYLPASVDPATAARELISTIGQLAENEWLILDLEEGSGNQATRAAAWKQEIVALTGRQPWLYSGSYFAQTHNLEPEWVAAYQSNEPTGSHPLWQNTDVYPWPWGKGDGSIYHGTLADFLAATGIGVSAPSQPTTNPIQEEEYMKVVTATNPATGKAAEYLIRSQDVLHVPDSTCANWAYREFNGGQGTLEAVPWECILWMNKGQVPS